MFDGPDGKEREVVEPLDVEASEAEFGACGWAGDGNEFGDGNSFHIRHSRRLRWELLMDRKSKEVDGDCGTHIVGGVVVD